MNIGPKGFTGENTVVPHTGIQRPFAVPVYLGVTDPNVTKNLLKYRYQQIDGAFHNAKEQGLWRALYPMVTFDGIEFITNGKLHLEEIQS
ncbi:hypothetical protein RYX41_18435 [Lactiplantibacillus plantarum]|nr:hypothetical protein [Lactiplantibacillus plantarum]